MKIYYLHHSAVAVDIDGALLVFDCFMHDPEKRMQDGYISSDDILAYERVYFFVSHSHFDHFSPRIFDHNADHVTYIVDSTVPRDDAPEGTVFLSTGDTYDDDFLHVREFASTDIGGSFFVRRNETSLFHAGDLNNWHWKDEGNARYSRVMGKMFERVLGSLKAYVPHIDVAFFPVDKRLGTEHDAGALTFIQTLAPDVMIPIHFQSFDDTTEFCRKAAGGKTRVIPVHHKGERVL